MFKIRTRIGCSIKELKNISVSVFNEEWGDVEGFVEVVIGGDRMGYYHENPLRPNEKGGEWITWWLSLFLDCANMITKTNYVAFVEPETIGWLEFILCNNIVIFSNAIEVGSESLPGLSVYEKPECFSYREPKDIEINLNDFLQEIYRAAESFLDELKSINPQLMESEVIKRILELYEKRHHIAQ
ncbi:MAG: hypothetical protein FWC91_07075 [Defluviitaleaceae bacterium]|nr:hypothetical protein [Defluviitaleaceae bacterium]